MPTEIRNGNFREDLFYRLNVFPLNSLPLADRADDIIPIATALLRRHVGGDLASMPWLDRSAIDTLLSYSWPGNVRELENVLQRALVLTADGRITGNEIFIDMQGSDVMRMHNSALTPKLAANL
jgi:two-component system response regulator FlrC